MYFQKNDQRARKTISVAIFLFLPLFTLLPTGCKKDDAPGVTTEVSVKSRLLGKWKVTSRKVGGNETIKDCDKDDTYEFKADDKVTYDYGTNLCSSSESKQIYPYSVSTDGKTFTINQSGDPQPNEIFDTPRTILKLTATELQFTYTNPNGTFEIFAVK